MATNVFICLTTRAQYARVKTALLELNDDPEIDLDILVSGGAMVRKYGEIADILRDDGLEVTKTFQTLLEGGNPTTAAKTTGLEMIEIASALDEIEPDMVLTTGDRYETMSVTIAASYSNVPVVHFEGGEITGSIDDKVRHSTTKLADYHIVSTERSKEVVKRLGEDEERVYLTGCPSIDLADRIQREENEDYDPQDEYGGVGADIDVSEPYLLIQYHPLPTEYKDVYEKTWELIHAVDDIDCQKFWFWPNMDAGTDQVSKAMREYRDQHDPNDVRFYINLAPEDYLTLVKNSECVVGNSSVGIRECSYFGVPVVNVGQRQQFRERAENVIDVEPDEDEITEAIRDQLVGGRYPSSSLYGDGNASERILQVLKETGFERKGSMDPHLLGIESEPEYGMLKND